jgi:hypothetical protein
MNIPSAMTPVSRDVAPQIQAAIAQANEQQQAQADQALSRVPPAFPRSLERELARSEDPSKGDAVVVKGDA